jgi:hypothetical protein
VAGTYPIQVSLGTLHLDPAVASNYTFVAFVPGLLTISRGPQTITFNTLYSTTYGSLLQPTATASSGLPITLTISGLGIFAGVNATTITLPSGTNSATVETRGVGTLTITATQPGSGGFAAATPQTQTVAITPAPLNITANPVTQEVGVAIPGNPLNQQLGSTLPVFTYQVGSSAAGAPGGFRE